VPTSGKVPKDEAYLSGLFLITETSTLTGVLTGILYLKPEARPSYFFFGYDFGA